MPISTISLLGFDATAGILEIQLSGSGNTTFRIEFRASYIDPVTNELKTVLLASIPPEAAPATREYNFSKGPLRFDVAPGNEPPLTFDPNILPENVEILGFLVGTQNSNGGLGNSFTINDIPGSFVICFLEGTLIATPSGGVAIETLSPGDLVLTADGRAVPVRFVGRQTVAARFAPAERVNPIRIAAGALAENMPARDLFVSPSHGIVVDGVLCFASALVNGTTIAQVDAPAETFAYYAIETEGHEVILAENCPAETFMDHVPRARWDNYRDYVALHGEGGPIAEMDLPHAKSRRQVPAEIHARIAERAAALLGAVRDAA